jgi:hypothetical protein
VDDPASEWAAAIPSGRSDRLRAIAPVVLLVVVALLGVRNHVVRDQTSWRGASFGMFATYDNDVSRRVIVSVDRGDGVQRVGLPDDLRDDVRRLRVAPTSGAARALARAVLERVPEGPATVRVEVRGLSLDAGESLRAHLETIVDAEASR